MFIRRFLLPLTTLVIAFTVAAPSARAQNPNYRPYQPCRDAYITSAYWDVTGSLATASTNRGPEGYGDTEECNPRLYGGGSWSSYADLVNKVRASLNSRQWGVCRDPWVTQAVSEVKRAILMKNSSTFAPIGAGESGECNMYLYSNGSWSSYAELKGNVQRTLQGWKNNGFGFDVNQNFAKITYAADGSISPSSTYRIGNGRVLVMSAAEYPSAVSSGIAANAGSIVAGGAGNIIAGGAGNVVAAGAGNIVAGGGGNFNVKR